MIFAITDKKPIFDYNEYPNHWENKYRELYWEMSINDIKASKTNRYLYVADYSCNFVGMQEIVDWKSFNSSENKLNELEIDMSNLNENNNISESTERNFLYVESPQSPLKPVDKSKVLEAIKNPRTGKVYDGYILEGVFADLNEIPNNNNRLYDIPAYLELVKILKTWIHSPRGVYGELEHPKSYSVNYNNVSHKILDIYYDEKNKKVRGIILVLNTPNGRKVQEILDSGGQIAMSARAAGKEKKLHNGTSMNYLKLLTTYDIVYHPGFDGAVMDIVNLNESQKFLMETGKTKGGYSHIIYEEEISKIPNMYKEYINLNESADLRTQCFQEWMAHNNNGVVRMFEDSEQEIEKQQEIMQENEPANKKEIEKDLQNATDDNLSEDKKQKINKKKMFENVNKAQQSLQQRTKKHRGALYDNSAGFINYQTMIDNGSNLDGEV